MGEGVTTVEIKSGYGLSLEHERKMLRVARTLGRTASGRRAHDLPRGPCLAAGVRRPRRRLRRRSAAHAAVLARRRPGRRGGRVLRAHRLQHAADASKCSRPRAQLGLPVKLHAEQLSDSGGAQLAARYGALSCDHLEWLSEAGAVAMAQPGSVAVLLPGAFYFLRDTRVPPVELLRRHGVPMAVSTDCNPGSSPCTSLLLMLNMACTLFRLTPEEALAGVTRNAARALGPARIAACSPPACAPTSSCGMCSSPRNLSYAMGFNPRLQTVFKGRAL